MSSKQVEKDVEHEEEEEEENEEEEVSFNEIEKLQDVGINAGDIKVRSLVHTPQFLYF